MTEKPAVSTGRKRGPKFKLSKAEQVALLAVYDQGLLTVKAICEMFGISKPTLYAILRRRSPGS